MRFLRASGAGGQPSSADAPEPATGDPELADLLAAAARGSEQAFADFYDRTSPRVYGMVLRVVRDPAQAAEVTQDVYLQIWREAARFDATLGSVLSWLLMIAHRRAVDRVRSVRTASSRDDRYALSQTERPYDEVTEQVQASLDAQRVRTALHDLTDTQREAISLAYFAGYTHREIAALLNLPLGTAKTRIRDGLIRLRDALGVSDD
jgi:RNA polymerase sigma-70 factor (ECF subfamily)